MIRSRSLIPLLALAGILALIPRFPREGTLGIFPPPPTNAPLAPAAPTAPAVKCQLLLFTQTTCPPCRVLEASLREPSVKSYLDARFELIKVSWPDERFGKYGISGTPTLVALTEGGAKKRAGAGSPEEVLEWLRSLASAQSRRPRPSRSTKIVEAGYDGPDGRRVMVDFPAEWWKANITSRGQGCCVRRSVDFAAHEQNVPQLYGFPEWIRAKDIPGGSYPDELAQRIAEICKDRHAPLPGYVNAESKDYALLKLVLATGRLACVDYSGNDGVHYNGPIAHMVCLNYADDDYVCILDNNFPPDKCLWMPAAEFRQRWGGWLFVLCAPRPPKAPWN